MRRGIDIPGLQPDLVFRAMTDLAGVRELAFATKRAAVMPHVAPRWAWDDALRRTFQERRYADRPFQSILRGNGISERFPSIRNGRSWCWGEFYLLPDGSGRVWEEGSSGT